MTAVDRDQPNRSEAPAERQVVLMRHGETEWARLGRHTGRTDIELTEVGRDQAHTLGRRLTGRSFALVLTSPLSRAAETAALAGYPDAIRDPDLREWDYGALEGLTSVEIRTRYPGWRIWTGPWPGGEQPDDVAQRADRVIDRLLSTEVHGDTLIVAHGHLLRVLAARWLHLPPTEGRLFALGTATISVLGWEHDAPVIESWNERPPA